MLHADDAGTVRRRFGVAEDQIRRDHLVAHVLAALQECGVGELVFFGGTALAYTHLLDGRVSEDVDLLADPRPAVAGWLDQHLPRLLRREFPGAQWLPAPSAVRSPGSTLLVAATGESVRVQVLDWDHDWRRYPVERRVLDPRYRDVASTTLQVPTLRSFAVMKASAYGDRQAARDLVDLAALIRLGAVDAETSRLARAVLGRRIRGHDFRRAPRDWAASLAHQMASVPDQEECLALVARAWDAAATG